MKMTTLDLKGDEKLLKNLKEIAVLIGDDPDLIKKNEDYVTVSEKTENFLRDVMDNHGGEISMDDALEIARKKAIKVTTDE